MSNAITSPGNDNGPCLNPCSHIDCIAARQIATELCRVCHERIGYEKPFYIEPDSKVHKSCLEDELLKKLSAGMPGAEVRFLTYEETAELLRVEVGTLRNWVSQEKIPYRKAGGNILFLLEEILAWTVPQTRKQGSEKRQSGQSNRSKSTRLSPVS